MKRVTVEKWLRGELKKMRNRWGYDFRITIIQKNKKTHSKIVRLHDVNRTGIYSLNNAFWITVNILKRMKTFYGYTRGNVQIKFTKLRYKK